MIVKEFNRRVVYCSLGFRIGNQCKVRIKNLFVEYNRIKDQLLYFFLYYDIFKEIINNKGALYNEEDVVRINIFVELIGDNVLNILIVVTVFSVVIIVIFFDVVIFRQLRFIKLVFLFIFLNVSIASQVGQYFILVQVYSEVIFRTI